MRVNAKAVLPINLFFKSDFASVKSLPGSIELNSFDVLNDSSKSGKHSFPFFSPCRIEFNAELCVSYNILSVLLNAALLASKSCLSKLLCCNFKEYMATITASEENIEAMA